MGLKIAKFRFIDHFGATQNALMTWSGADINYGRDGSVRFAVFENAAEQARNLPKAEFVMPIGANQVLAMFGRSGVVALEISEASWSLAAVTKFVPTRRENPETGEIFIEFCSLKELDAEIVDIGLPEGA